MKSDLSLGAEPVPNHSLDTAVRLLTSAAFRRKYEGNWVLALARGESGQYEVATCALFC